MRNEELTSLLKQAYELVQKDNIQEALNLLQCALKEGAQEPQLHNFLANIYRKQEDFAAAIAHYQFALTINPHYAQAHNNLAALFALQNRYQDALHHYRSAIHSEPDFVLAHYNVGLLLLKQGELKAAIKQFKNVLTLDPSNRHAHFYLGLLFLQDNRLQKAEKAFQQVLNLNPEDVEALSNLGVIAIKMKKPQLAVDYFSKACALDNTHQEARNNLAALFMHHDRFENALMHYDVLLKQHPEHEEYLYNSGVAQMALGHLNEAMLSFNQLIALNPQHAAGLNNLAAIYLRLKDQEKAKTLLEQALLANPQDKTSLHMLNALSHNKTTVEASSDYALHLFNNYALYYDKHLLDHLKYTLPQQLIKLLDKLHLVSIPTALELGCGTGLIGQAIRDYCTSLVGVDISPKMLIKAEEKGIYDAVIEADALFFLKNEASSYDLILAIDVLPYFAELKTLISLVVQHLKPGGHFLLSTEISDMYPWQLQSNARFCHHQDYLAELAREYNLNCKWHEIITARQQDGEPVKEFLIAWQKKDLL